MGASFWTQKIHWELGNLGSQEIKNREYQSLLYSTSGESRPRKTWGRELRGWIFAVLRVFPCFFLKSNIELQQWAFLVGKSICPSPFWLVSAIFDHRQKLGIPKIILGMVINPLTIKWIFRDLYKFICTECLDSHCGMDDHSPYNFYAWYKYIYIIHNIHIYILYIYCIY